MPTVSTTPLSATETKYLDQCRTGAACASLEQQISRVESQLAELQSRRAAAATAHQTTLKEVLTAKSVDVPDGATISRQTVDGVDSLIVATG